MTVFQQPSGDGQEMVMMMFSLYVQQNQWIWVTLLAGIGLTIMMCLIYWGLWRPREQEGGQERKVEIRGPLGFFRWVLTFTPWVLILVVIATAVYSATHLYLAAHYLPNW